MKDAGNRPTWFLNFRRYLLALAVVYGSIGLRILLNPILGPDRYPFLLLLGSVVFCSWYWGVLPSIVATLAGLLYVWRNFLPPSHSFALSDPKTQFGGMVLFAVVAGVIIFLGHAHRRVRNEARTNVEKLRL